MANIQLRVGRIQMVQVKRIELLAYPPRTDRSTSELHLDEENLAGTTGIEPVTADFGDRNSTN